MSKNSGITTIALSGVAWSFVERVGSQIVTFIVSIILARLLSPNEYSAVAVVMIFVTIANVFVTSGFGSSLVQKMNVEDADYSTTFCFSICFSFLLYFIIYFLAPSIALLFEMQILTPLLRVLAIRIIFASINSIQYAYIAKNYMFKKYLYSTLIGTIISAIVGVFMAYAGYGVWSLVAQYLVNVIVNTFVLLLICDLKPRLVFSWKRMSKLLSYGWKIMLSDVFHQLCQQIRGVVLGKSASPVDLSFYEQGQKFPSLVINNVETSIQKVFLPIIANVQNDKERVLDLTRKSVKFSIFIIWPILIGIAIVGKSLIKVLYSDKWLGCVPYLQIICFEYLLWPVSETYTRTIKALGESGLFLKMMILSQMIGLICLFACIFLKLGAMWIIITRVISTFVLAALGSVEINKMIKYRIKQQVQDTYQTLICCMIMIMFTYPLSKVMSPSVILLCVQFIIGVLIYIVSSYFFNKEVFFCCLNIVKNYVITKKRIRDE